jgi:hypothetical protein
MEGSEACQHDGPGQPSTCLRRLSPWGLKAASVFQCFLSHKKHLQMNQPKQAQDHRGLAHRIATFGFFCQYWGFELRTSTT